MKATLYRGPLDGAEVEVTPVEQAVGRKRIYLAKRLYASLPDGDSHLRDGRLFVLAECARDEFGLKGGPAVYRLSRSGRWVFDNYDPYARAA